MRGELLIRRLGWSGIYLSVAVAIAVPIGVARGQAGAAASQGAALPSFHFEVAAIKPHPPDGSMDGGLQFGGDSFSVNNLTVQQLISYAYELKTDSQLQGLPKWADTDRWDVNAKVSDESVQALHKLPPNQIPDANRFMFQNLLAQRFHLKVHHEMKPLPIYELTIAKDGLKLKANARDKLEDLDGNWSESSGKFNGKEASIATLADALSYDDEVDRIVVDKTGLAGKYDIHLQWTPDDQQGTPDAGPTLITALEEQLGLKLSAAKGPVDTLVVDHIERPSAN